MLLVWYFMCFVQHVCRCRRFRVLLAREQSGALDSVLDVQPHRKSVQFTVHNDAFTLSAVIM